MNRRILVPLALIGALAFAPAMAGCSMVQDTVRDASGGTVDIGGTSVPSDFPDDVPLVEGDVLTANGVGEVGSKVWNVSIRVESTDAIDGIRDAFEDAGFDTGPSLGKSDDAASATFTSSDFLVGIVIAKDDAGYVANYTVTRVGN